MENLEENSNIEDLTVQHLWNIGRKINSTSPALSRYYIFNLKRSYEISSLNAKGIKQHLFCQHCGSLWSSSNHKIRFKSPAKKNNHIKKLLKWEAEQPWKLNNRQKKKLQKYRQSTSEIVHTCLCCKKATKQSCFERKVQTKEKMASLYMLPTKIKPMKRDLNAGLLVHSQKNNTIPDELERECNSDKISDCDTTVLNNESPSSSLSSSTSKELKITSNQPQISKNKLSKTQNFPHNVSSPSNISKSNKKKKSLLAQILKQEEEARKKKLGLSSFLVSI